METQGSKNQLKRYCKWTGSQTARQQTQPAQPSQPNQASPTHPHSTQPAGHPNITNSCKLCGFPQGLGTTVNSDVFAAQIKHDKTHEFDKIASIFYDIVFKCTCFCVISYEMQVPANTT